MQVQILPRSPILNKKMSNNTVIASLCAANESASCGIEWHSLVGLLGGFLVGYLGTVIVGLWWLDQRS
jgi:hypothetical protein